MIIRLALNAKSSALAVLPLALLLQACGSGNAANGEMEARISELEKKVEAADKRSRQAISLAAQPNSAPPPDAGGDPVFDDGGENSQFDSAPDAGMADNQDGMPSPPMIGPGN